MSESPLTPRQQVLSAQIIRLLREAFPDMSMQEAIDHIQSASSNLAYNNQEALFHSGAFCIYWGKNSQGELVALLHKRKDNKYGAIGGFIEGEEQSFENAQREAIEEVRTGYDTTVFVPELENYSFLMEAKNFKLFPPLQYSAYSYQLSDKEMAAIEKHIQECNDNPDYMKKSVEASHGETNGLELVPLDHFAHMSPDSFNKPSHLSVFREVAELCNEYYQEQGVPADKTPEIAPRKNGFIGLIRKHHSKDQGKDPHG